MGEFATFDDPPEGTNWLQFSLRGGATLGEQPEMCILLDDGDFGRTFTMNFGLDWSDGEWLLQWTTFDATFSGPVTGMVEGNTATFEGEADGLEVQGSVTCFEP